MQPNSIVDIMIFQNKHNDGYLYLYQEYYNNSNQNLARLKIDQESKNNKSDYNYSRLDGIEFNDSKVCIDEDYNEYYINNDSRNDDNDILNLKDIYD